MESRRICVLGSANADYFLYVNSIPVKGETIQAHKYMTANGGKGANQAVAAAKLNAPTTFLGQAGNDDAMHRLAAEMEKAKVQLSWKILQNEPTGMAYIYVDKQGQNSIVIYGGANMAFKGLQEDFKAVINSCDYLLLQKEIPMSVVEEAAVYAHSHGKVVILDCGGQDVPISDRILSHLTYISPNETELLRIDPTMQIGEEFVLEDAAQEIRSKLLASYPNLKVLLKLGSKGSAIITTDLAVQGHSATAINSEVLKDYKIVDTVGAGDCFTGAFAVKHSQLNWAEPEKKAQNYREAMVFGNSAAFLCITRLGAMPSMPVREEVDQFITKYAIK